MAQISGHFFSVETYSKYLIGVGVFSFMVPIAPLRAISCFLEAPQRAA